MLKSLLFFFFGSTILQNNEIINISVISQLVRCVCWIIMCLFSLRFEFCSCGFFFYILFQEKYCLLQCARDPHTHTVLFFYFVVVSFLKYKIQQKSRSRNNNDWNRHKMIVHFLSYNSDSGFYVLITSINLFIVSNIIHNAYSKCNQLEIIVKCNLKWNEKWHEPQLKWSFFLQK